MSLETVTFRLDEDLLAEIDREADALGFSNRSDYLRFLLRNRPTRGDNTSEYDRLQPMMDERAAESGEDVLGAILERLERLEERLDERPPRARSTAPTQEHEPSDAPAPELESGASAASESGGDSEAATDPEPEPTERRETAADPSRGEAVDRAALIDAMPGRGDAPEARADAVLAMRDRLRERGAADWQDLLDVVDPDEVRYQDRNSFWKNAGRKGLKMFDEVERPPRDSDEWTWVG